MPFLEIISLGLVFMWTLRLARAKSRSPWIWCGAALAPVFLTIATGNGSWQLISMAPMAALLFMKGPRAQVGPDSAGITCPRCQAGHPHGRYYCTSCGWELTKAYPAEAALADESPRVAATFTESMETAGAVAPPAEIAETPAASTPAESTQVEEPVAAESVVEEALAPPAVQTEQLHTEEPAEEPAPAPAPPSRPLLPQAIPTAVALTDRGTERLTEGRVQESIDQFTKALAMDPNYAVAWEKRAEAFSQMGRDNEAEEDRRRLAAINAG
jgi:hypothetical protein